MQQQVVDALSNLDINGAILDKDEFGSILKDGTKNIEFTKLVSSLTNELRILLNIDEQVNPITNNEDAVSFNLELSSFLKELKCPYKRLLEGHISDRLQSAEDKLLLLEYLTTEIFTAKILQSKTTNALQFDLEESKEANDLKEMLLALGIAEPPPNITVQQLFDKLSINIEKAVKRADPNLLRKSALTGKLSDEQMTILKRINEDLNKDYGIRRKMLLTRLDVTVQSFHWSDKEKGSKSDLDKVYTGRRKMLEISPNVELADVFAARDDISIIEKVNSSSVRKNTKSSLNRVIIGDVPDRGGRTSEQQAPPLEMPSWQQRTAGPSGGQRGGNFQRGSLKNNSRGNNREYQGNQGHSGGGNGSQSFDSAGFYGGRNNDSNYDHNASKRSKTYDSYQSHSNVSYSEQYSQDEQHNQQYHRGRGRGGRRGRGNYRGQNNY